MKILFIVPYPFGHAPSQRFRFEQYLDLLKQNGNHIIFSSFLNEHGWELLYKDGSLLLKFYYVLRGFLKRLGDLLRTMPADYIFIHREATPLGPPIFEWIVTKMLGKRVIYDFDDAIWLPNTSVENRIIAALKFHGKARALCRWSWRISCGNQFLCEFAQAYNQNIILNPTTIDTHYMNPVQVRDRDIITVGWTGSHSTIKYLDLVVPAIKELEKQYAFRFLVISDKDPELELESFEFKKWNKRSEISDLHQFDIGLMPLMDDEWALGKCGFKALQYMAVGIPALVSPVGVNKNIVTHGEQGYHCTNSDQWRDYISQLLTQVELRKEMGSKGRQKVINDYSVESNSSNFMRLFRD